MKRRIINNGQTELIERIVDMFGQPFDARLSFPYEVDITKISNEAELTSWILDKKAQSQKILISEFDFSENKQRHRMVIRFVDHVIAVEFKLRIEY
jgi:hypothetical protein